MICKNCKKRIPDDSIICPKCKKPAIELKNSQNTSDRKSVALVMTGAVIAVFCLMSAMPFIIGKKEDNPPQPSASADNALVIPHKETPGPTPESTQPQDENAADEPQSETPDTAQDGAIPTMADMAQDGAIPAMPTMPDTAQDEVIPTMPAMPTMPQAEPTARASTPKPTPKPTPTPEPTPEPTENISFIPSVPAELDFEVPKLEKNPTVRRNPPIEYFRGEE